MSPQQHKRTLHDVPIFEKLSPTELKLITNICRTKRYKKSQIIFLQGEVFSGFYVISNGSVKIYKLNNHGVEVIQQRLDSFRSFAESALFSGTRFYSTCAQAIEDSTLLFFPRDEFTSLLDKNPALAIKFSVISHKWADIGLSADGRVARYLFNEIQLNNSLKLPEPYFNLTVRKKDLAEHLGIANETLSRTLKKLKEEKIIRETSKKIFITNVKKLRELAQE